MKRITLVLLIWSITAAFARQQDLTVNEITEKLQQKYETIQDVTARFTEHVKFGYSQIEQDFSGTLSVKKPNKYRVESEQQTLVTDGTTAWAYSPTNKQVLIDRYKENQSTVSPDQFLLRLPANYYATLLGTEKSGDVRRVTLKLVPKDDQSFVKSMKVTIDEGSWIVRKVEIVDVNDTETTYTVHDVKVNTHVKDSLFTFTPPPGTEVVDLR